MKYLFGALALLLVSCSDPFIFNIQGYEVMQQDLDTAWKTVSAMKYIDDPSGYLKSPQEFFADGGGDCEDFAAAMVYLLGETSYAVLIQVGSEKHTIVQYDAKLLDPQKYGKYYSLTEVEIIGIYSYTQVMIWATNYGIKQLSTPLS